MCSAWLTHDGGHFSHRYDPQPSAAELMLPLLRAHAPPDKQPFVGLLSDDAHAIRSSRLGEVESQLTSGLIPTPYQDLDSQP